MNVHKQKLHLDKLFDSLNMEESTPMKMQDIKVMNDDEILDKIFEDYQS